VFGGGCGGRRIPRGGRGGEVEIIVLLLYPIMFGSVVTGVFQIIFCIKIHVNDIFLILKIIFDINTSKQSKTYKLYLILIKKI
jgi:hypothetical protein